MLTFSAAAGSSYYIAVDGKNGATGDVVVSVMPGTAPYAPINLLPPSNDVDRPPTLTLQADDYTSGNFFGTMTAAQWVVRRTSDNAVFLNRYIPGTSSTLGISGLTPSATYGWQVRYLNDAGGWTPFSSVTAFTVARVWPPRISASMLTAAIRSPMRPGRFRVTRSTTTGYQTVYYTVSGSAVPGFDYDALPGYVVIPNGSLSADIPVTPLASGTFPGKRFAQISLRAVNGYTLSPGVARMTIRGKLYPQRLAYRTGNRFQIDLSGNGGTPGKSFAFGGGSEKVLYGDFNNDGRDDLALVSGNLFRIRTAGTGIVQTVQFGSPAAVPFVGDYDGDGREDIIVRSNNVFTVDTRHTGGAPGISFGFGTGSEELILTSDGVRTGDWDGDGRDDIVIRPVGTNVFKVRLSGTGTVVQFRFGAPGQPVYLADLNGDGKVEPVLWNLGTTYTADVRHDQLLPLILKFGLLSDNPAMAADLDGNGRDDLIIQRENKFVIDLLGNGGGAETVETFGPANTDVYFLRGQ